jgi:hypothetical protein
MLLHLLDGRCPRHYLLIRLSGTRDTRRFFRRDCCSISSPLRISYVSGDRSSIIPFVDRRMECRLYPLRRSAVLGALLHHRFGESFLLSPGILEVNYVLLSLTMDSNEMPRALQFETRACPEEIHQDFHIRRHQSYTICSAGYRYVWAGFCRLLPDMESLGCVMLYFCRGSLSWQGLKAASKKERYDCIMEKKTNSPTEVLSAASPKNLRSI